MSIVRFSNVVVRRTFHVRSRKKFQLPTRIIPYIIEMSDKNNITLDHVYSMCTTMMETEMATIGVQVVLVILSLGKYKPKSKKSLEKDK